MMEKGAKGEPHGGFDVLNIWKYLKIVRSEVPFNFSRNFFPKDLTDLEASV